MKTLSTFKHLSCFFAFLFIGILGVIAPFSLSADVIESFPESDFWPVDHTTPQYSRATYPQDTVVGYYYKRGNEYQLTDTIDYMTVAIWNKNQIDLNQNWEFDLKLFFGTGNILYKNNKNKPAGSRAISDGFCFALHYKDSMQNLIGSTMQRIGYGHISPSFAIEFDTEHNGKRDEGYDTNGSGHHIAYLKNGNMTALSGTYQPMQNNWASVGLGDWFDVRIVWRKGYKNGDVYYDLLTYMQEGPNTNRGPLLLRDSMRFNSLSEVIEGLEVDENCQALVTWGGYFGHL